MRPRRFRTIHHKPTSRIFTAIDNDNFSATPILLFVDELEALRLAELEDLYHSDAAAKMNISRPTFGRIIKSARKKVADHFINCTPLIIKGGDIQYAEVDFECVPCNYRWKMPLNATGQGYCPLCGESVIKKEIIAKQSPRKRREFEGLGFREEKE